MSQNHDNSKNLTVDIESTDKAPSIKPNSEMIAAATTKGSLTPSNVVNDSNKINIYYDYEEDHHYSIKLEDSLYFEEEYHNKSLQDIMKIFLKQEESISLVEYLIKGIYHFFTNAFAPPKPATPNTDQAPPNTTTTTTPNTNTTTTTTTTVVDNNYHLNNILTFLEKYSGLQLLHHLLITYSDQSVTIANYGCLIIIIFISAMPEMKELLGHLGFCEIITYILQMNIGIAEISEHGLYAVAVMTKRHFPNIRRFSKISQSSSSVNDVVSPSPLPSKGGSGKHAPPLPPKPPSPPTTPLPVQTINICELISQIGIFGCNLRHPRSVYIARNVCLTIGNLSEPIFTKSFKNNSILPLLIQLYQLHYKNEKIFIHSFFYSIHRLLLLHPWFFIELINNYKLLLLLLNQMIDYYHKNIPILFRLWQVLIHCYQRAYSASASASSSSLSPRTPLASGTTTTTSANPFELFKEELMKEDTHFLLFEKIFIAMNYEQLATTPELIAMMKLVDDLNPSRKNTSSYNPHFEWLESHEVCEKYIEFILNVQQYALRADEFESYSSEKTKGVSEEGTNESNNENPPTGEEKRG